MRVGGTHTALGGRGAHGTPSPRPLPGCGAAAPGGPAGDVFGSTKRGWGARGVPGGGLLEVFFLGGGILSYKIRRQQALRKRPRGTEPPGTEGGGHGGCSQRAGRAAPPVERAGTPPVCVLPPHRAKKKNRNTGCPGGPRGARGAQYFGAVRGRAAGATRGSRRPGSPSRRRWWGCGTSAQHLPWRPGPRPIGRR